MTDNVSRVNCLLMEDVTKRKLIGEFSAMLAQNLPSPKLQVTSAELVGLISTAEARVAELATSARKQELEKPSMISSGAEYWERKAEMLAIAARLVGESEGPHVIMLSDVQRLLMSPFDLPGVPAIRS